MKNHSHSLSHPAWIEINLSQFANNLRAIRQQIGQRKLCLPIKANAYGHGIIPLAQTAISAGADYLAVSCLQEGALLRKAGIKIPILVMGAIHEDQITELLAYELELSISSLFKAQLVAKKCQHSSHRCRVHLEIDTGMQRTGVRPESAIELLNYLIKEPCFEVAGVYSHLATADKPNNEFAHHQIQTFKKFIDTHIKNSNISPICHLANSGGVCYYPESYFDMVRPGLLALGYFPERTTPLSEIASFFSVKAKIAYFKVVSANCGIGYGHTYKTKTQSRIVTIPLGYGDGYRRALSNKGQVLIRGKRHPIVGNVCMDQIMVDVGGDETYVGEEVVLIGRQKNEEITLEEIAEWCDTISYEILCGFNDRLPRFYL